jgi:hypothetical protein
MRLLFISLIAGIAVGIDTGDPSQTTTAFKAAVDQIRGASISCTIVIPPAPDGRSFDKEKVGVRYASGTNDPTPLTQDQVRRSAQASLTYNPGQGTLGRHIPPMAGTPFEHSGRHCPVIMSGACPSGQRLGCVGAGCCPGGVKPGRVGRQTPAAGGEPLGHSATHVPSTASRTWPAVLPLAPGAGWLGLEASATRTL